MSDDAKAPAPAPPNDVQEWQRLIKDIAAMITLAASGVYLASSGHEQTAGTVFGGLLMYLVPSSTRIPRAAVGIGGAVVGGLLAAGMQG